MKPKTEKMKITTPVGRFLFPRLQEPDTKFNKDGEYSCSIILSKADAEPVIADLERKRVEFVESERSYFRPNPKKKGDAFIESDARPWKDDEDEDGNPTGNVVIKTKLKAKIEYEGKSITLRPSLIGAHGGPFWTTKVVDEKTGKAEFVKKDGDMPMIGSGTKGRLAFEVATYNQTQQGAGITLRLKAAQIINLVEGSGEDYGFADESEEGDADMAAAAAANGGNAGSGDEF